MSRRFIQVCATAALIVGLTTGCQAAPDIAAAQAEAFQSRVLAVSTSVADGGYAAALEELTALETELNAAASAGTVTFSRHQRIEAALVAVRADIQAAIDAATPAEPVEPTTAPDDDDEADEDEADENESEPGTETEAEKKAREKAEKAAEKAAEDAKKKAEDVRKKAEEDAKKDAETTPTPTP
ncbi:cobalamin biosynthesis protein CobT [Mycetocola sp. CAN_C7]|uniref:hypothetical protein n=1 Tax=Mycetocola sp. CAN_C7 TaxID=2787724 RepID=UPI0018C8EB96